MTKQCHLTSSRPRLAIQQLCGRLRWSCQLLPKPLTEGVLWEKNDWKQMNGCGFEEASDLTLLKSSILLSNCSILLTVVSHHGSFYSMIKRSKSCSNVIKSALLVWTPFRFCLGDTQCTPFEKQWKIWVWRCDATRSHDRLHKGSTDVILSSRHVRRQLCLRLQARWVYSQSKDMSCWSQPRKRGRLVLFSIISVQFIGDFLKPKDRQQLLHKGHHFLIREFIDPDASAPHPLSRGLSGAALGWRRMQPMILHEKLVPAKYNKKTSLGKWKTVLYTI